MKKFLLLAGLISYVCVPNTYALSLSDGEIIANTISHNEISALSFAENSVITQEFDISDNTETTLSDSEILDLYEQFIEGKPSLFSSNTSDNISEFTDYCVALGVIDDTPTERSVVSKVLIRSYFKAAVTAGNVAGYTTAAYLLNHSLQDNPANLTFATSSTYAYQVERSTACQSIINSLKSKAASGTVSYSMISGSTTLNSTTDLMLSYNKVNYKAELTKMTSNGLWRVDIVFTDTYDFAAQDWKNSMTDNAVVTLINNQAAAAQSSGAIQPYNITVKTSTYFYA